MSANTVQSHRVIWMIRRHMPDMLAIERASFEFPWAEHDFIVELSHRNVIGMSAVAADDESRMLGFMIYELFRDRLVVRNFAVHPEHRRRGVGTAMVDKLASKLSPHRRDHIELHVRETNLAAQLFFRSRGFRAVSLVCGFYKQDSTEDAYRMRFALPSCRE